MVLAVVLWNIILQISTFFPLAFYACCIFWHSLGGKKVYPFKFLCEKNDIDDEFHYLFVCNHFKSERKNFLKTYFYKCPNIIKFKKLLSTKNINLFIKVSCFIEIIMKNFSSAN